ncbi:glutathione S-transferase family protein [Alcanivorax sp. DP30]|uniref:glutathione S-transferase family protein n=1 Tax=Alcanivorax sp. DP30 TaxID=2606217 RepID=UPI001367F40E|nr:glutathione S-transferase family protein [Alcanivorax sp. DP30]MZR62213.1 glutathione S-transferase family protein [Alcanivorax sp. DP30]
MTIKLYGAALSPFVRKTRVALALKGIEYESVHVDPTSLPEGYEKISPMKRIPALEVDGQFLADSAAICAWAEKINPEPALYPTDAMELGRTVWFERFVDYDLAMRCTFAVFRNRVVMRLIGKECDEEKVQHALETTIPPLFEYLDGELKGREFLVGDSMTIADIALASQLVNFRHGGESVDAGKYPHLAAHVQHMHALEPFAKTIEKESGFVQKVLGNQ